MRLTKKTKYKVQFKRDSIKPFIFINGIIFNTKIIKNVQKLSLAIRSEFKRLYFTH